MDYDRTSTATPKRGFTLGVNFRPTEETVFKLDYNWTWKTTPMKSAAMRRPVLLLLRHVLLGDHESDVHYHSVHGPGLAPAPALSRPASGPTTTADGKPRRPRAVKRLLQRGRGAGQGLRRGRHPVAGDHGRRRPKRPRLSKPARMAGCRRTIRFPPRPPAGASDLGWAVVLEEKGRFKPITFLVHVEPERRRGDGTGHGLPRVPRRRGEAPAFPQAVPGRDADDQLRLNRDVVGVTGATLRAAPWPPACARPWC